MRVIRVIEIDWERLHFCRDNKVKYRKHLTYGMIVSAVLSLIGLTFDITWLSHLAVIMNTYTAILWIWE